MIARTEPGRHRRITRATLVVAALLAALLAGCKPRQKAPVVAAAPAPAVSSEPVSAPQTTASLPPPQAIPPDAIPPEPEPAPVEVGPPQGAKTPPRTRPVTVAPPPAGAAAPQGPTQPPATGPATNGTTAPSPQLRPIFPADQERELRDRIERSLASAEQSLSRLGSPPSDKRSVVARIRSFIRQARQAQGQGDLNRASSLAQRAELMASDLARTSR